MNNLYSKNILLNDYISNLKIQLLISTHALCHDWNHPTHKRKYNTFYLIKSGIGNITIDGVTYKPTENMMLLIPKNSMTDLAEGDQPYYKYWCDFEAQFEGIEFFDLVKVPLVVTVDNFEKFEKMFLEIEKLSMENDIVCALKLKSILARLIAEFIGLAGKEPKIQIDSNIENIIHYIDKNISSDLSVEKLSSLAHFHPKYFIRIFKKSTGYTPAQYVKLIKIEKAKGMLLNSDKTIENIANNLGYSSVQPLFSDFKKSTGYTPIQFRKNFFKGK